MREGKWNSERTSHLTSWRDPKINKAEEVPGWPKVAEIWVKKFQKILYRQCLNHVFMVEMDSALSKTCKTLNILKFNNYFLDLQNSLSDFL